MKSATNNTVVMKITDLNGQEITITDLDAATAQAAAYKAFRHDLPKPVSDSRLQTYWTDIYNKLIQLQKQHNNEND